MSYTVTQSGSISGLLHILALLVVCELRCYTQWLYYWSVSYIVTYYGYYNGFVKKGVSIDELVFESLLYQSL